MIGENEVERVLSPFGTADQMDVGWVIEEDFDQIVVEAFRENDADTLKNLPANMLNSGNSEIRNWVTVAGGAAGNGLAFNMVDYVPCYRSEAGTGNAMGFAYWA